MGRQESLQLIERKTQVDTDAQETSRASKCRREVIVKKIDSGHHWCPPKVGPNRITEVDSSRILRFSFGPGSGLGFKNLGKTGPGDIFQFRQ